jgi:TolB protein
MKLKFLLSIYICLFLVSMSISVSANEIVQLTDDSSSNYFSQWSPNGEKLVYISFNDSNQLGLWIMNSNGSNKQQISSSAITGADPWSPDGTKIIYFSLFNSSPEYWYASDVWLYDTCTSKKTKVIDMEKTKGAQWVYNGSKLFIVDGSSSLLKLWLVDPDDTSKTFLSSLSGENTVISWQPNGNRILYTSNESGNYDIWIMNPDGSGKTQLTSAPSNEYAMGFSPDGGKVVYSSRKTLDNISDIEDFIPAIWIMDADGSNKKQLIPVDEKRYIDRPSWSPDGTKIAFESRNIAGDQVDIVVVSSDGSNLTVLTGNDTSDMFPQWSPEGDKIAFTSVKGKNMFVSVITLDDEWKSAPTKTMASVPAISQGNGKKSPGFPASLVMMTFLIAFVLRKRK